MTPTLRPPDVKAIVMRRLTSELDGVDVVSTRPDGPDAPKRFVRVVGTGGPGRHMRILQTVQVTLDSYAESKGAAFELARDVDAVMHALPFTDELVARVHFATTPADYPDPDITSQRYTATYQFTVLLT